MDEIRRAAGQPMVHDLRATVDDRARDAQRPA
jgi:hypothetical protein